MARSKAGPYHDGEGGGVSGNIVIVGAGVAGLACARFLADAGRGVVVIERSRGVGGRCATRRVQGQAVDHGVVFFHGSDPGFLSALRGATGATLVDRWPIRVEGSGRPCQPDAFSGDETRLAYAEGTSALPKSLARGLDVRLETRVVRIEATPDGFDVATEGGNVVGARDAVLALPAEQASDLLGPLASGSREAASARAMLGMVGSLPCLTVLAGYARDVGAPEWHVSYPEDSLVIQLAANDTSKRPDGQPHRVFVYQARPCWSRSNLEEPAERWSTAILREAGRILGSWAASPLWSNAHRWRYARADRGNEFSGPLLLRWPAGGRLGLVGEAFAPGGGVEAAWLSGRKLARRLLEEE